MTIPQRYKIMIMSEENIGFIDVKLQSTAIAAIAMQPKITHKAISCFDAYGTLNFLFFPDIKFPFKVVLTKYHTNRKSGHHFYNRHMFLYNLLQRL